LFYALAWLLVWSDGQTLMPLPTNLTCFIKIQIGLNLPRLSWNLGCPFQDNLVRQHQKRSTNLDFNEARDNGVAVASAGPNANHLHVAPDR